MDTMIKTLNDFFGAVKLNDEKLPVTDKDGNTSSLPEIFLKIPTLSQAHFLERVEKHLQDFLNLDITTVLSETWNKANELREYFDPQKYPADKEILVPLVKHKVKSTHDPYLEIALNKSPVCQIKFEVEIELELEGVILKIKGAKIHEAHISTCKGKGEIKCEGVKIKEKEFQKINLPGVLTFDVAATDTTTITATPAAASPAAS